MQVFWIRFTAAIVLPAALMAAVVAPAPASADERPISCGLLLGDPYFASVVGEAELNRFLAFQMHGGTNLDDFCVGGRLLLKRSGVFEPYLAAGGGVETRFSEVHPLGIGAIGLRLGRDRVRVLVELNRQLREEGRLGESQWSTGGAGGLLVELGPEEKSPAESTAVTPPPPAKDRPMWGVAVGLPYTIAATYERPLKHLVGIEAHVGSILVVSSIAARMIVGRPSRTGVYGFAGGGIWLSPIVGESDRAVHSDNSGVYPFGWAGGGGRFGDHRFQVFAEAGLMLTEDAVASGLIPTIAGGIRLRA